MVMRLFTKICVSLTWIGLLTIMLSAQQVSAADDVVVLGYQDIPGVIHGDREAVDRMTFIRHIEYLRMHGYIFVSLDDIVESHNGGRPLPDNAVLLTFDNAYLSFYEFVYPVLQLYRCPCVLSVITSWIGDPPDDLPAPLMNWDQLGEVAQSELVTIASGTHNLVRDVEIDAAGSLGEAATCLAWDPYVGERESETAYRKRINDDLYLSQSVIRAKLGVETNTLVWPGGHFTVPALEEAAALGFSVHFVDDEHSILCNDTLIIPRHKVKMNQSVSEFKALLEPSGDIPDNIRGVRIDLDRLFTLDTQQLERNISTFLARMKNLGVSTVYLQGCTDPDGNGTVNEAYFPNRVLPMRADLFGRIAGELDRLGIDVYASMPVLRIALPGIDAERTVHERYQKDDRTARDMYRVSPFDEEAVSAIADLYEDIAAGAPIKGVLFEEDGYLTEQEDFSASALSSYSAVAGSEYTPYRDLGDDQRSVWVKAKTDRLIQVTRRYLSSIRKWRPGARSARMISPRTVVDSGVESMYAQDFAKFIKTYDEVVVMANPLNTRTLSDSRWLRKLVSVVSESSEGLNSTVFIVASFDHDALKYVEADVIREWFRDLVSSGAYHIAYDMDDYINGVPELNTMRLMISKDSFPAEGE